MKNLKSLCFLLLLLLIATGLIAQGQTVSSDDSQGEELTTVKVGITPYSMYQIWHIAKGYGFDEEFGINLDFTPVTQTMSGVAPLIRGELDITANCIAEHVPTFESAPNVVNLMPIGYFQGFIFVGRRDEVKSFDELKDEMGLEKAKEYRLNEFKNKSFCVIPQRKPLIIDAINQVGLTEKDVKFMEFADDQKAAVSFMRGEGDFYIGSLPQERRLILDEENYVNAGGSEILGPGGLWYDTMVTTKDFLENDRETALRLLGIYFKTVNYFYENIEEAAAIGAKGISEVTGEDFPVEEYIIMQTEYDEFQYLEDAKNKFYNPNSEFHWSHPVNYYVDLAVKQGDLKTNVDGKKLYQDSEDLFNEFLKRDDLLEKIE